MVSKTVVTLIVDSDAERSRQEKTVQNRDLPRSTSPSRNQCEFGIERRPPGSQNTQVVDFASLIGLFDQFEGFGGSRDDLILVLLNR